MTVKTTMMADLLDPQVLADWVEAELPNLIAYKAIAPIDDTLVGQAGTKVEVPQWVYIGDAEDVAEGEAIPYEKLTHKTKEYTIKKIGKGVEFTDEAILGGHGAKIEQGQKQLGISIARKLDADTLVELKKSTFTATSAKFGGDLIDAIEDVYNSETTETGVIFMNPKDWAKHRKAMANDWERASSLGDSILVTGVVGRTLGWDIVKTKTLAEGEIIAVKAGACKTYMKRGMQGESARDIDHKKTKYNVDLHGMVSLVDESKVVKATVTTGATGDGLRTAPVEKPKETDYVNFNKAQLLEYASELEIEVAEGATNAEIKELIRVKLEELANA